MACSIVKIASYRYRDAALRPSKRSIVSSKSSCLFGASRRGAGAKTFSDPCFTRCCIEHADRERAFGVGAERAQASSTAEGPAVLVSLLYCKEFKSNPTASGRDCSSHVFACNRTVEICSSDTNHCFLHRQQKGETRVCLCVCGEFCVR